MSFALDRFRHLRRFQVFIEDVNGPRGGTDKRARIVAEFAFATLVAQETQTTWQSAVSRAVHRIARNAARQLQRMNRAPIHRSRSSSRSTDLRAFGG
jgi:putative sigma-54 modulation protein